MPPARHHRDAHGPQRSLRPGAVGPHGPGDPDRIGSERWGSLRVAWHHDDVKLGWRRPAQRLIGTALAIALLAFAPADGLAARGYRLDLAGRTDFVRQYTNQQCIGASIQMMLNIVGERDDRTSRTQRRLWDLAKEMSWVTGEGPPRLRHPDGATARGWARALNRLAIGPYLLRTEATYTDALRVAARAIRATGRPVGLLTWTGDHAWVMSGFSATADPATSDGFRVTGVTVLDPWYPRASRIWGRSPAPLAHLSPSQLGRWFVPWVGRVNRGWNDRYVFIVPTVMPQTPHSDRLR